MAASIPVSRSAAARFAYTLAVLVITAAFSRLDASGSAACSALADQQLPNTTLTSAQENRSGTVQARGEAITGLPPFCQVIGVIQPTPQSQIRFEVWLPLEQWNGKFSAFGNPGWGGNIAVTRLGKVVDSSANCGEATPLLGITRATLLEWVLTPRGSAMTLPRDLRTMPGAPTTKRRLSRSGSSKSCMAGHRPTPTSSATPGVGTRG